MTSRGIVVPAVGVNRVYYSNAEVDGLKAAASAVDDDALGHFCSRAQQLIAAAPYISLWYKTNVAVFQPDIQGVRLSPIADFLFLKDLSRAASATTSSARQ